MKQYPARIRFSTIAALMWLAAGQLHAAEITSKKICNTETDRVIDLHMATNLPADKAAQIDSMIKELQAYCRHGAFEAAQMSITDAEKLLKK